MKKNRQGKQDRINVETGELFILTKDLIYSDSFRGLLTTDEYIGSDWMALDARSRRESIFVEPDDTEYDFSSWIYGKKGEPVRALGKGRLGEVAFYMERPDEAFVLQPDWLRPIGDGVSETHLFATTRKAAKDMPVERKIEILARRFGTTIGEYRLRHILYHGLSQLVLSESSIAELSERIRTIHRAMTERKGRTPRNP